MLKTPIRLEWDLPEREEDILSVGENIISSGIFQLAVRGAFEGKEKSINLLLSEAKTKGIKVFLFLEDKYPAFLAKPELQDIVECFVFKPEILENDLNVQMLPIASKKKKAISAFVTKNNFENITDIIDKSIDRSFGKFIVNNFNCWNCEKEDIVFALEKLKLENFKQKIAQKIKYWENNIELVIRDFFISSVFYPERDVNVITNGVYNGCQAGSAVAYIRQDGKVYGCSSTDMELGDIKNETLRDIWTNKAGMLKKQVSLLPQVCIPCEFASWCQGGCRGRANFYYENYENPDPMCLKNMEHCKIDL